MQKTKFQMPISEAASALASQYVGDDVNLTGVSTDTRTLTGGELYIALKGPNFDGHDFVSQAIAKGAMAVMVDHDMELSIPQLIVADTRLAMGQLARYWREQFSIPVIGVTGSNGKTTVKEMLASILSGLGEVHATKGNLNNDIGVPLTLFQLGEHHTSAVIEMGANHAGEIEYLVGIAKPDIAIITNAGAAHLEGFGSLEGVAKAKGEIYAGLSKEGIAIVNGDDKYLSLWREIISPRKKIEFGIEHDSDVSASFESGASGNTVTVKAMGEEFLFTLSLLGKHNIMNSLAAIAATKAINVPTSVIVAGLEKMQPVAGRLRSRVGVNGSRIIDDTYNANPTSLKAGIAVLNDFVGEHFLALGDMGELGSDEEELHQQVGQTARQLGVDRLYTIGNLAGKAASAFGENAYSFEEHKSMIAALNKDLHKDVTLLVKGSRRMHMERVVEALTIEKGA
ncbi:MAG: UDP-N-acetylmuramoyl-tripeptide--D-alanyl-D-alanine ligase [Gammaproteobacteria bacterium]|nr:UDP-N-acetylmuramoyl-tripeptide--D-alanyl-D-alanine ligase [Gammaproteobacteria bacterium]